MQYPSLFSLQYNVFYCCARHDSDFLFDLTHKAIFLSSSTCLVKRSLNMYKINKQYSQNVRMRYRFVLFSEAIHSQKYSVNKKHANVWYQRIKKQTNSFYVCCIRHGRIQQLQTSYVPMPTYSLHTGRQYCQSGSEPNATFYCFSQSLQPSLAILASNLWKLHKIAQSFQLRL